MKNDQLADFGVCPDVPCKMFREMKDPDSTEEEHQRSLIVRVERLKAATGI